MRKPSTGLSAQPTFPEDGLRFLRRLKRNNNREWFNEQREVYEETVRQPVIQLIEALADEFERFAPEIVATPKASLFRIHRDTRFSKDKSPYKTQVAAMFSVRELERHAGAGFYFHIAPTELWIGGGLYRPQPDTLRVVREHIAEHHRRLEKIVAAAPFRGIYGALSGEQTSRMPRGYAPDHPAERFLRLKDWIGLRQLPPDRATNADFLKLLSESFRALHPLILFLNEPLLSRAHMRRPQEPDASILKAH